jgi:hypothetical protein
MTSLPSPLAVACHDAGAANLIVGWLKAEPLVEVRAHVQGPAARIFSAADVRFTAMATAEAALSGAAALLSGTGWASDLEHDARALARQRKIRSIAVLDHWVNYPQRFQRRGEVVLPDEIWVADAEALALALSALPGTPVRLQPNRYLEQMVLDAGPPPEQGDLLYLLEPMRDDWGRGEPGEFQALDYLVANIGVLQLPADIKLRLRPHPSEGPGKYADWMGRQALTFQIDCSPDLAKALAGARWVAGCETAGLAVAIAAGRTAVCTLPPWAPRCRLPHKELVHLQLLVPSAA